MLASRPILPLLLLALSALPAQASPAPANVAVAASAADAVGALAAAYARTGHPAPHLVVGATGKFYQQIVSGAPFDLLFGADDTYTAHLAAAGLARVRRPYARGRLALWAPAGGVAVNKGWRALLDPAVRHVAIANPAVAPYGAAAVAAMKRAGVQAAVAPRLVMGESVAQAAQFVTAGAAEVGVLPLSLVVSPRLAGHGTSWTVPLDQHPALVAEAVVVKDAANAAEATDFLNFATNRAASAVWRRFGFEPVAAPAARP